MSKLYSISGDELKYVNYFIEVISESDELQEYLRRICDICPKQKDAPKYALYSECSKCFIDLIFRI